MKKICTMSMMIILISSVLFAFEYLENKEVDIPGLERSSSGEWIYPPSELCVFQMPPVHVSTQVNDSIEVEFDEVIMDFHLDTTYTAFKKLDGSTDGYQHYPVDIVVDPEGKIWVCFWGEYSREYERPSGEVIRLTGLHCFMPNGEPAPFSPIEFLEFDDGTKDTLFAESQYNGTARGLTMMDNGNILYTAWSTIYKIDYQTGEGIAMWYPPKEGFMATSMTEPAYDPVEGLIYVGHVMANKPIYMLDEDLCYIGNAVESCDHLHRSIVVRTNSDGSSRLYSGSIWNGHGIHVYESPDALYEPYEVIDTIGNEFVVTDSQTISYMAWASYLSWYDRDKGILLYGNYMGAKVYVDQGDVPEAKHASQWVFLDVDEDRHLGSFGKKVSNDHLMPIEPPPYSLNYPDGTMSPRGAAFYKNSIYTVDFDLNMLQKWTITSVEEPILMNITVRDSMDSTMLTYGWAPNATDAFDVGLDEYDSLLAPAGFFDAHFGDDLIADVKAPNYTDSITWTLNYQAGDGHGPIAIEWDSTAFPEYGEFALRDTVTGSYLYLDMRESSSFTVPDSGLPSLEIVFIYDMSADFEVNQDSGHAPLAVRFSDRSKGNIRSWNWDFGDGKTSKEKNPIHVYENPGTYDVSLTVDDRVNEDAITKTAYIKVLYPETPEIVSITDVPDDQGGWVCVDFTRSYYDMNMVDSTDSSSECREMYTVEVSSDGVDWVASTSTYAYGRDLYSIVVHTLGDSSAISYGQQTFRVVAGMAVGNFIGGSVNGYSVDNIAPPAPTNLMAENTDSGLRITWVASDAPDVKYYNIFGSMNEDFSESILLGNSIMPEYLDNRKLADDWYYYRVSAVDIHDNLGPAGDILTVEVGLGDLDLIPDNYELVQNYPNPFNPSTTFRYGLPEASDVKINIYDISGKKIMEWDMKNKDAGWHHVIWNGKDAQGDQVPTGMYIYHLRSGEFSDTKKMILMK